MTCTHRGRWRLEGPWWRCEGCGRRLPVIAGGTMVNPNTEQLSFRGRNDDGNETTATWIAAVNTNWTQAAGVPFRLRYEIEEDAGAAFVLDPQLQSNKNGAGWTNVTATSAVVRAVASPNLADGTATTNQLTQSVLAFVAGVFDSVDGLAGSQTLNNQHTEPEYCLQLVPADVATGDTVQLRVTDAGVALNVYTNTPSLTVGAVIKTGVEAVPLVAAEAPAPTALLTGQEALPLGAAEAGSVTLTVVGADAPALSAAIAALAPVSVLVVGAESAGLQATEAASGVLVRVEASEATAIVTAEAPEVVAALSVADAAAAVLGVVGVVTVTLMGADVMAVPLQEVADSIRALLVGSDSTGAGLVESPVVLARIDAGETTTLVVTEVSRLQAVLDGMVALSVLASEVGLVTVALTGTDVAALSLAEVVDAITTTVAASDLLRVGSGESPALFVTVAGADGLAVGVAEAGTIAAVLAAAESLGVGASDAGVVVTLVTTVTSATLALADAVALQASFDSPDMASVGSGEITALLAAVTAAETAPASMVEVPGVQVVAFGSDVAVLQAASGTTAITVAFSAPDAIMVGLSLAQAIEGRLASGEALATVVAEVVAASVVLTAAEALALVSVEAVDQTVALGVAETLAGVLAEAGVQADVTVTLSPQSRGRTQATRAVLGHAHATKLIRSRWHAP